MHARVIVFCLVLIAATFLGIAKSKNAQTAEPPAPTFGRFLGEIDGVSLYEFKVDYPIGCKWFILAKSSHGVSIHAK